MSNDKQNLENTKKALKQLSEDQARLISNTIENLKEGSYWSLFTEKEFSKVFGVDFKNQEQLNEVRNDLSNVSSLNAIETTDGSWSILATYSNIEDFFTLFNLIDPSQAPAIEKVKTQVYGTIQTNIETASIEIEALIKRAIKKSDPFIPVAIYSLNKSGKTTIKGSDGKEHAIKSFAIDSNSFFKILDDLTAEYGVTYSLVNPIYETVGENIDSSFVRANSSDKGGIYTYVQLG